MTAATGVVIRIWKKQPGKFFTLSTKDRSGDWKDHFFRRSEIGEITQFCEAHSDKDLYFCPHGLRKPRRLKRNAEMPHLLYADLDEADPREMGALMPSIAWESSPGRYAAMWVIDELFTEEDNRGLTYHLKADPGGWDLSQVLRIPGTTNYKYESAPKGRLLWADGDSFILRDLRKLLPKPVSSSKADAGGNVALGIYRKYESKFSGWVRRNLLRGKPKMGKRSEVLWKLTHEIMEAGCTRDEAFELLRSSPWNKFVKRRDGDEQLKREIDKSVDQHLYVVDDEKPREELGSVTDEELEDDGEDVYRFLAKPMSDVEEENIDWIWYPYLARGEVTILEGDPGLGKSYLAQMAASAICDGRVLPSVKKKPAVMGKVAYFDIENAAGSVTKKRLVGNGCRNLQNFYQEQEPFTVDDDETLDLVYAAIEKLRPTLVVFDTINTYLGSADTHNSAETQQVFKRFGDIARRFKTAVLVLRHLTKSSKGVSALYRGQGSIAFAGFARVVCTVGTDPNDPERRVMAVTKINVCRPPKALTFTIEELPPTLKEDDRSKFLWGEFVDLTADEILAPPDRSGEDEMDETVRWLEESLADGAVPGDQLLAMAEPRGVSEVLMRRAATKMGVVRDKKKGVMMWSLPTGPAESTGDHGP